MSVHLEITNLVKTFDTPTGPLTVVDGFDLRMTEGEFVSIIGHSGCGKSTVLSIVAGLAQKTHGALCLGFSEIDGPGTDRGVVFQSPSLLPWMTAIENVMLAVNEAIPKAAHAQRLAQAAHYLELVGLKDSLDKKPAELSQGMQQRVGIARAFALSPKLLLLDEPFGMLDSLTRLDLQQVLLDLLQVDHKTALMVTHDIDEALFLSDRVVMMTSGPRAKVGEIVTVPFPRPRDRAAILESAEYAALRGRLVDFLHEQDRHKPSEATEKQQKKHAA